MLPFVFDDSFGLALADLPHCCSTPENKLTEGVMLVHRGNCSFMAKANVAEAAGASAILIINNRADFGHNYCVLFFWISATCLCCLKWFHISVQNSFSFPCGSSVKRYHSR